MEHSIRLIEDGDRFYIVFEHPTNEDKEKAIDFVKSCFDLTEKTNEKESCQMTETLEGISPAKVEPYEVEKTGLEEHIPQNLKADSFNKWMLACRENLDERRKEEFKKSGKNYIKRRINNAKHKVQKTAFIKDFEPSLKNTVERILKQSGYSDLNTYFESESDNAIKAAFNECAQELLGYFN